MKRFLTHAAWPIGVFVLVLLLWQGATVVFKIPPYVLPGPLRVIEAGMDRHESLLKAVRISAVAAIGGFLLSVVAGVATALCLAQSPKTLWSTFKQFGNEVRHFTHPCLTLASTTLHPARQGSR